MEYELDHDTLEISLSSYSDLIRERDELKLQLDDLKKENENLKREIQHRYYIKRNDFL